MSDAQINFFIFLPRASALLKIITASVECHEFIESIVVLPCSSPLNEHEPINSVKIPWKIPAQQQLHMHRAWQIHSPAHNICQFQWDSQ
jgi:hypothetical protein